jgi:hypothetical protein
MSNVVLWHPIMCLYVPSSVLCCPLRFPHKTMFVCLYLHFLVGGFMTFLRYLFLLSHSGVQHKVYCVFVLLVFVLCLVCPMLSISLDNPFLIAPFGFSNGNLKPVWIWKSEFPKCCFVRNIIKYNNLMGTM